MPKLKDSRFSVRQSKDKLDSERELVPLLDCNPDEGLSANPADYRSNSSKSSELFSP